MAAIIEIAEYNPLWPEMFQAEKIFLEKVAGKWLCGEIAHVGSTSIPGLSAKPIIDIMFGVKSLADSEEAIEVLQQNGYCYAPYKAEVMHWFCKPSESFRTHHLHLVPFNSALWHERINFRNLLRSSPELASEYADLKRNLSRQYSNDRETYTNLKWPFIQKVLEQSNV
jgi:GrpB-like predicted nucleotidyltransferase (UPF0157 family)